MPGDRYTQSELATMPREDFEIAAKYNFESGSVERFKQNLASADGSKPDAYIATAAGIDLSQGEFSEQPPQINLGSSAPRPAPQPSKNVWGSKRPKPFVCPSGQTCLLRRLEPERLMEAGLLDRVTRLEGLANELVQTAEGQPPSKRGLPSTEDFQKLLEVINLIVPLAVVEPKLYAEDDSEAPEGAIYVTDVDLEDRMAIMEEALKGLRALDRFRHPR